MGRAISISLRVVHPVNTGGRVAQLRHDDDDDILSDLILGADDDEY